MAALTSCRLPLAALTSVHSLVAAVRISLLGRCGLPVSAVRQWPFSALWQWSLFAISAVA